MFIPRHRLMIALAVTVVFLLILWCWLSPSTTVFAPQGRVLNIAVTGDAGILKKMNPSGPMTRARILPLSAIYESPVTCRDSSEGPRPLLAVDWRYSPDGKTVELDFKQRARFHNGKLLEAEDVKKCWEKTLISLTDQECINLFEPIQGYDRCLRGQGGISGIQVKGKHTLVIKLTRPNSFFISSLSSPVFWVYDPDDTAKLPAGTGPFKFESIEGSSILLSPYVKYHGGATRLEGLCFTVYGSSKAALEDFAKGKVDIIDELSPQEIKTLENDGLAAGQVVQRPIYAIYAYGFNLTKDPYAENYMLRRALNYAIDRKAIIDEILSGAGLPARGPLPQGISGYSDSVRGYAYDPDTAAKLLAEAGYPGGKGLPPLQLLYPRDPGYRQIAKSVAEQLSTLGIEVHLRELLMPQVQSKIRSLSAQTFAMGWNADYAEGYDFLYYLYSSRNIGHGNYTGYRLSYVDSVLDAAAGEVESREERNELIKKAARMVTDDAPMLWLYQPVTTKLVARYVEGFSVDNMNEIDWLNLRFNVRGLADESKS